MSQDRPAKPLGMPTPPVGGLGNLNVDRKGGLEKSSTGDLRRQARSTRIENAIQKKKNELLSQLRKRITIANDDTPEVYADSEKVKRLATIAYILPVFTGMIWPFVKVAYVALSDKLIRKVIKDALSPALYAQIENEIFSVVRDSSISNIYLMYGLDFYQTLAITVGLSFMTSVCLPLQDTVAEAYMTHRETKRLQCILYDRFILEPNSISIDEARDVLYTRIPQIATYWAKTKYRIVDNMVTLLMCLTLVTVLAWDMGCVTIGVLILCQVVGALAWKVLSTPWAERRDQKEAACNSNLIDLVTCRDVVLTHTMELQERRRFRQDVHSDDKEIRRLIVAYFVNGFFEVFLFAMLIPAITTYVYWVDLSMERVFHLLIFMMIIDEGLRAFLAYSGHKVRLAENKRAQEATARVVGMSVEELFHGKKPKTPEGEHSFYENPAKEASFFSQGVVEDQVDEGFTFEDVSLGYSGKDGKIYRVVESLNLSFLLGERYALLGESGAGKSTVLKAISGLIPTLEGTFSVGGIPVQTFSRAWRRQVAVVSQDSLLFNRTLRENLTYGHRPGEIPDTVIFGVLAQVRLQDRIRDLQDGLDTMIRQNGWEFSGGQRQRLQIARCLITRKDASIVLLDEVTSALDTASTQDVLTAFEEFLIGKTMVMITHDLSTVRLADITLEMKCGGDINIVEGAADAAEDNHRIAKWFSKLERVDSKLGLGRTISNLGTSLSGRNLATQRTEELSALATTMDMAASGSNRTSYRPSTRSTGSQSLSTLVEESTGAMRAEESSFPLVDSEASVKSHATIMQSTVTESRVSFAVGTNSHSKPMPTSSQKVGVNEPGNDDDPHGFTFI